MGGDLRPKALGLTCPDSETRFGVVGAQRAGWPLVEPIHPCPLGWEEVGILGNLLREFDFSQDPLPPLVLDPTPLE